MKTTLFGKGGHRLPGVQTIAVFEILQLLGGMDQDELHTVELIEVTSKEPPEDFTDSGHPTAGRIGDVYQFAAAAGHELYCCSVEARPGAGGTHWIIGCYYPTSFMNKYITRYEPEGDKASGMRLHKWTGDHWETTRERHYLLSARERAIK